MQLRKPNKFAQSRKVSYWHILKMQLFLFHQRMQTLSGGILHLSLKYIFPVFREISPPAVEMDGFINQQTGCIGSQKLLRINVIYPSFVQV